MTIFDFKDYRSYLKKRFPVSGESRGSRTRLAERLKVQSAFVSRVMAGQADFSLEQACVINAFLSHTPDEGDYFMLLLQFEKAGSPDLRRYFANKIDAIQLQKREIRSRMTVTDHIPLESQIRYYSHWVYPYLHLLVRLPGYQTRDRLIEGTPLPRDITEGAVEWMIENGIFAYEKSRLFSKIQVMHLDRQSPLVLGYHQQWRRQAMNRMDLLREENLFFTSPVSLAHADFEKVRALVLELAAKVNEVVMPSADETIACLNIDLFKI
jgi:uncharacterized protein (TIGR02147 family)